MKKPNILAIIFLVIAIVAIFYNTYAPRSSPSKSITVVLDDKGFSPDKITITQGTTVTFLSRGEHLHWPASNPHPVHTSYPDGGGCIGSKFDACRGLKNGETYSFQFDVLGSWGAHDHLFPGSVMVIDVVDEGSASKADTFDKNKAVSAEQFRKLSYGEQTEIIKSMASSDPTKAWAYLKDSFMVNGQVVGNGHEFAHIVGNQAFNKFGLDGVKVCDESFAFGCFHGVTEKMLLTEGISDIKSIETGCLKIFPPDKSQNYTGCIHGVGHGVYSFEGGDLKKALSDCDMISDPYRQYCYDGAFMENSFTPASRVFDAKDPWKACTDLDQRYYMNCARYQSQIFLGTFGAPNPLSLVGKYCSMGPNDLLKETCFESLGYYVAQGALGSADKILLSCKQMPSTEGIEMCTDGAATENTFQRYNDYKASADRLCKTLSEPRRASCLTNIARMTQ